LASFFFQPTHQNRLSKRELTEYDLISFIVSTCSADKTDMLIQGLCDQTFQSALMGNFPFLTYYCKTIGAEMRYCKNMNRHTIINQNDEAKRFVHHRPVRNLNGDKKLYRKEQELNIENDLEQKMIMQMCIKTEKSSVDMDKFCNRTLHEINEDDTLKLNVFASIILVLTIVDMFDFIHYYYLGHYQNHHLFYHHHQQILLNIIITLRSCHHQYSNHRTSKQ